MSDLRDPVARAPVPVRERDRPTALPASPPPSPPSTLPAPVRTPAIPDPTRSPAPVDRRLPEHKGKLARIGDAVSGLGEDLKEWIELRIELAKAEIEEQVDYRIGQAKQGAAAALFAALGGMFFLLTLAFAVGWILSLLFEMSLLLALFLGFLVVTLLLFVAALVSYRTLKPKPPPSATVQRPA